jgi:nucleoporin NUP82
VQVGQFYHAAKNSAPIAKIEWHPWGEAASTLLVMTADGKLRSARNYARRLYLFLTYMNREYDISVDTEEPQQVLSFVPERKSKSYLAEDASARQVASFALGKGRADWGPLTVYALMKSGDIYAICPYLPKNAYVSPFFSPAYC